MKQHLCEHGAKRTSCISSESVALSHPDSSTPFLSGSTRKTWIQIRRSVFKHRKDGRSLSRKSSLGAELFLNEDLPTFLCLKNDLVAVQFLRVDPEKKIGEELSCNTVYVREKFGEFPARSPSWFPSRIS